MLSAAEAHGHGVVVARLLAGVVGDGAAAAAAAFARVSVRRFRARVPLWLGGRAITALGLNANVLSAAAAAAQTFFLAPFVLRRVIAARVTVAARLCQQRQ